MPLPQKTTFPLRRKGRGALSDRCALCRRLRYGKPTGILAVCKKLDWDADAVLAKKTPFLLLAEELNDPGNLGTVIRTADACGADAVFLSKGSVDLYNPKVLRATMGSLFHVPVFQNIDLHALSEKMQAKQIPLYAAHLKGDRYPYALPLQDACAFLVATRHAVSVRMPPRSAMRG